MFKYVVNIFFILLGLLMVSSAWASTEWEELEQQIKALSSQTIKEANITKELVQKDKKELKKIIKSLQSKLNEEEKDLDLAKKEFSKLQNKVQEQRKLLEQEKEEINAVQGIVVSAAKKADQLLKESPIGPELENMKKDIDPIVNEKHFPGMEDIKSLVSLFLKYIDESGDIEKYKGSFVGVDGRMSQGDIGRIGGIGAVYKSKDNVGYLRPGPNGENLVAVEGNLSWFVRQDIKKYLNKKQDNLSLDISKGAGLKRLSQEKSWTEWLQAGGVLVWPIFFIGLLAVILGIERLIFVFRIRSNSDRIMSTITDLAEQDKWEKCREYCLKNSRYPTCQVLKSGLDHLGSSQQVLENALQEALLRQLPRLERFLPTLSVLAAIAPLMGLLGTVTGMINTFQVITIFGAGDPKLMAGGISEALITTQLGLAVAIPVMFLHHFLERRSDKILGDIEEKGAAFTLVLLRKGQVSPKETQNDR